MKFSKHKKVGSQFEVRAAFRGRAGKQFRRRFDSLKQLENFRTKCLQLDAYAEKYAERFIAGEDFLELLEIAKNPTREGQKVSNTTFKAEYEYWRLHNDSNFSPGWKANLEGYWAEQKPLLENMIVAEISPRLMNDIVLRLVEKKNSKKTIHLKLGFIKSVLNFSVEHKRIEFNPIADFTKYTKKEYASTSMDFWQRDDAIDFLRFASLKYPPGAADRWIYVAYLTVLNTGIRAGELWALKPRSAHDSLGLLEISEQWDVKAKEFRPPKGVAVRRVPLNADVMGELSRLAEQKNLGRNDLYFSRNGEAIDHDWFYVQIFKKDLREWKGPKIVFHGLRHTAGTLMISAGVDVKTVQEIFGHVSIEITMRYVHVVSKSIQSVGNKFMLSAPEVKDVSEQKADDPKLILVR